jgi:3'(2'), 5'-bisphosphate nucleotidase
VINLPDGLDIDNLINDLRVFSWEASETLIYYAQILRDSDSKINILENDNNEDPVTLADLKVNETIIKRINEKYKHISWEILSEENVKRESNKCKKDSDWLWVLDPLDGTKDFIQGESNYAMHLALNYKKKPYIGVVLIPEKNELWIADGKKCWGERRDGSKIGHHTSSKQNFEEMTLVTSKNHNNKNLRDLIEKIPFKKVIVMGSIGCKIASIVKGDADIYICLSFPDKSSPKDWDFAAPEALLNASGGRITNLNNENLTYNKDNFEQGGIIIASSEKNNHKDLCLKLKEIIKEYDIFPLNS